MTAAASMPSDQHVRHCPPLHVRGGTLSSDELSPHVYPAVGEEGITATDLADRYRLLVEHTPDAIVVHQFGTIRWMNPAGLRYLEATSPDQVIGHIITEFIHPDSITAMLSRISRLTTHGAVSEPSEATVITRSGAHIPAEAVSVRTTWNGEPAFQVILRDLTEHKAAQEALRYQAALVNHVSDAVIGVTADGHVSAWNSAAEHIYRRAAVDVVGRPLTDALGAACDPATIVAAGGRIRDRHLRADDRSLAVAVSAAQMDDGWVLVCSDQTAVRQAEQHFTTVVESLHEGVVVVDHTGRITSANKSAQEIFDIEVGADTSAGVPRPYRVLTADGQPMDPGDHPIAHARRTGTPSTQVIKIERLRDGRYFWVSLTATPLDPGDPHTQIVTTFADVTDQHETVLQLAHAATHDHLTGLPNRAQFLSRLDAEVGAHERDTPLSVLFIDLDDFKAVNDTHGHAVGDLVLCAVADRITGALRDGAMAARIGGDEFVVIASHQGPTDAVLRAVLATPYVIDDLVIDVRASIGSVVVPRTTALTARQIVEAADHEMYRSKPGRRPWGTSPSTT
nr:diguanylate cyclase [Rhodococcus sp. 15-1189-1-1a]